MSNKEEYIDFLKKEYSRLVASFDWYFEYSDDHSVWTRGQNHRANISETELKLYHEGVTREEINSIWNKWAPDECKRKVDA